MIAIYKDIIPIFDLSDFNDDEDMEWYFRSLAEGYDLNQNALLRQS